MLRLAMLAPKKKTQSTAAKNLIIFLRQPQHNWNLTIRQDTNFIKAINNFASVEGNANIKNTLGGITDNYKIEARLYTFWKAIKLF